ncbi:MAG: alpha/beta hydrolase [Anaerolineales bacterium]|nr:MAG: alpha/beta hydrolase [Anaerolineales bacterium]
MKASARRRRGKWDWVGGFKTSRQEGQDGVVSLSFDLSTLVEKRCLGKKAFTQFKEVTGLVDFAWRVVYNRRSWGGPIARKEIFRRAQGFVVFIHGWNGSGEIWESLPAMVCQKNHRLVAFVLDVNGFGGSPFIEAEMPKVAQCHPEGCMRAVEKWIETMKLRGRAGTRRIFTFVGHSMGGAALFYMNDKDWAENRYARCAVAPALLCNDTLRQGFYVGLGAGIGIGLQYSLLDKLKEKLAPRLIQELIGGASEAVKAEHLRIFERTDKGTLAQTFYALGQAEEPRRRRRWKNFRVILGHKDRLVGVAPMLNLLEDLGFRNENIRVVLGDHYLFSAGFQTRRSHGENRDILLEEILQLHGGCRTR